MVHLSSDMDLTELVLEEERDVDDEMDEEEEEVDKIKVEDEAAMARAKRRLSSFLNESFADDEDLDDEMDDGGEENGGGGEDGKSSSSASSTGGGGGCKYHCSECGESNFFSKKGLRQHVRVEHLETCYWTCQSCGGVFPDLELFKVHLVKVHKMSRESFCLDDPEENPLLRPCLTIRDDVKPCPECDSEFGNKTSLNVHRLRRHISKRLTLNVACPVCGEENVEDLTAHVREKHKVEGVVCPHCGKILSKTCTLNRHIEQVHLNLQIHKKATCEQCGKVFSKKGHLDRHIRTIHMGLKESSRPCPYCGKVFSTKSSLEPHIEMVHKGVRKACPECGKVLSDLWKHMRTVHGHYRRRAKIPKEDLDLSSEVLQNGSGANGDSSGEGRSPSPPAEEKKKAKDSVK